MSGRPDDAERFVRCLLALPDLQLRLDWLNAHVQSEPEQLLAPLLDVVIGQSEVGDARSREALLTVALWAAGMARPVDLERLRAVAFEQRLLSLQRVIRRPPITSLPPEGTEPRIPDYGTGRELTLGERRNLARRSGRHRFDMLIKDPHPMVIRELLVNPKTTEDDLIRMAAHRPVRATTIVAIAGTRWLARPRVRMSVLQNPGSPLSVALPLVGLCTRAELFELARAADVPPLVRITANELVDRRPPMSEPPALRKSGQPKGSASLAAPDSDVDVDSEDVDSEDADSDDSGPYLQ
jgi:hypothetical protein